MSKGRTSKRVSKNVLPGQLDMFAREEKKSADDCGKAVATPVSVPADLADSIPQLEDEAPRSELLRIDVKRDLNADGIAGYERPKAKKIPHGAEAAEFEGGDLLDTRKAARRVGLGMSTLEKMRCQGRGPRFVKLTNSAVRYHPSDLDAWIATRVRRSTDYDV